MDSELSLTINAKLIENVSFDEHLYIRFKKLHAINFEFL